MDKPGQKLKTSSPVFGNGVFACYFMILEGCIIIPSMSLSDIYIVYIYDVILENINNDCFSSILNATYLLSSLSSCLTHISPPFLFMVSESLCSSISHSLYPKVTFDFLGSMVTPSHILTSKDLVLRIKDEGKDVAFDFLDLGNTTQHNIF